MKLSILMSFTIVFASVTVLRANVSLEERMGIERGEPMRSEKGVYFISDGGNYVNVRVEDNQFVVVFLDEYKKVEERKNIKEIILIAESVRGDVERESYLLEASGNGLFYKHPRYIRRPYIYRIQLRITTEEQVETPRTASGLKTVEHVKEYGFETLQQ